jgi:hypothetical protein
MSRHESLTIEDVREEVKKFAVAMERRLRENEWQGYIGDKNGWESMPRQRLYNELTFEAVNLLTAIKARSKPKITTCSADIANWAMMLFDNENREKQPEE